MDYEWKIDKFDSEVLGISVAKILNINSEGSTEQLKRRTKKLIDELTANKIDYASIRLPTASFALVQALQVHGFVQVDELINLKINTNSAKLKKEPEIREAKKEDLEELKKITEGLYSTSRILNDPLIPKDRANNFYVKWIENSVLGKAADSVLVWVDLEKIVGYITLQKKGQIPLVGVSPAFQGRGIAKKLLFAALSKFKQWGVKKVTIETQTNNIPALRAYQGAGFKIGDSYITLRWARS